MLTGMAQFGRKTDDQKEVYERLERCRLAIHGSDNHIGMIAAVEDLGGNRLIELWPADVRTSAGCLHCFGTKSGSKEMHNIFFWPENAIPTDEQQKTMEATDPADPDPPKT